MEKYKTIEEVRQANGFSQITWAQLIGSTFRTYQARLQGSQPEWRLSEVIKAAEYNNGYIVIPTPTGAYKVKIEEVKSK